jgi:predicted 3-demethylubiquinone-9 3-methyltransferase (glyoxalase superfamily)
MQKITPFLWFDTQAEEAAQFYVSVFKNAKILDVSRYGAGGPGKPGTVMSVSFVLDGQEFIALNGGPHFTFNEAISLFVRCEDQREVDELWSQLCASGEPGRCGWLKDRYGISWQIVPIALQAMLQDPDRARSSRVVQALMTMQKLDIQQLRQAYETA